jgi:hypothetical protein
MSLHRRMKHGLSLQVGNDNLRQNGYGGEEEHPQVQGTHISLSEVSAGMGGLY